MKDILIFSKFCNEYEFLNSKLKHQDYLSKKHNLKIKQHILIETILWSGKINNIDYKNLDKLKAKYNGYFSYKENKTELKMIKSKRRCREDNANCILSNYAFENFDDNSSFLIISDIDEIIDDEIIISLKKIFDDKKDFDLPIFIKQKSCWFTTKYFYKENWPGPIIFTKKTDPNMIALVQTSRHISEERTNVIFGGFHISYLKSTIFSKKHNSHGLNFYKIRIILSLFGIHPFRRKIKSYINKNHKNTISFYKELSHKWIDVFNF